MTTTTLAEFQNDWHRQEMLRIALLQVKRLREDARGDFGSALPSSAREPGVQDAIRRIVVASHA